MVIFTMDSPPPLSSRTQCSTLLVGRSPGANCTRGSNLGPGRPALGTWLYPSGPQPFTLEVRWKWYQPACRWSRWLRSALGGTGRALPPPTQFSQQVAGRGGVGEGDRRARLFPRARLGQAPFSSPQLQLAWCSLRGSVLTLTPDPCPRPLAALPPPFVLPAQG